MASRYLRHWFGAGSYLEAGLWVDEGLWQFLVSLSSSPKVSKANLSIIASLDKYKS